MVYANNARRGDEDRNLYLDTIDIGPDATLGDEEEWMRAWRLRTEALDERTLEEARAAIERNRKADCTFAVVDERGGPVPDAKVSVNQVTHDFLFGCNIFGFSDSDTSKESDLYKQRFEEFFNYATTGFYWSSYEPVQGEPKYEATDKVVAWCAARGIRVKGHPLLWDNSSSLPEWAGGQPSPALQEKRAREIVSRYKWKIDFWEVVNEPAHAQGVAIAAPYRWAREANPGAHLIVNDYEVMATGRPS